MDLFSSEQEILDYQKANKEPLASRLRPRKLEDLLGQSHILGPGKLLRRAIVADQLTSLIFYGPPGTGKTTLAKIIAKTTKADFFAINAVLAGVKDIREAIQKAETGKKQGGRKSILFVDEVHRFNKSQQDALLPHVENGTLTLIGATTENPFFEVNKALLSRSRVFQLRSLEEEDIMQLLQRALSDPKLGYGEHPLEVEKEALEHIAKSSQGDARAALNALELMVEPLLGQDQPLKVGMRDAEESIQKKAVLYDKDGDAHYDSISAFIKSIRGSDPDAALHWMAKMIYAGEDPRFIFRRMLILASEDVGLADPNALCVVMNAAQAYDYVGLPEGQFHLTQACLYLANAPKSNSAFAYFDALGDVQQGQKSEVPNHLKDSSRDGEDLGHGQGYKYPHAYRDHWVAQQYLPGELQGKVYYEPSDSGFEKSLKENLQRRRELQISAALEMENQSNGLNKASNIRDYWVNRSLKSNSQWMAELRELMLKELAPQREDLLLDLSGYLGFLTWESLRWLPRGGVFSACYSEKEEKQLKDWSAHFKFENQPQVFLWEEDQMPASFYLEKEAVRFDHVLGFNLGKRAEGLLLRLLQDKKHMNTQLKICLGEFSKAHYHPFYKILEYSGALTGGELQELEKLENIHREAEAQKQNSPLTLEGFELKEGFKQINSRKILDVPWLEDLFSPGKDLSPGKKFVQTLGGELQKNLREKLFLWVKKRPEIPWTQGLRLNLYQRKSRD